MANNKFGFYATVSTPKQVTTIDLMSIGVWEQIWEGKSYPPGTLIDLATKFKAMAKKGKSPFNFHWTPYFNNANKVNQGRLFSSLSDNDRSTIELKIQVFDDAGIKTQSLSWNFFDVGKIRTLQRGKNEYVETFYTKFN